MTVESSIIDRVRESVGITGDPAAVRIVAAMSGGVDSSVVAALLKLAGFDVVGITLQLYDHGAAIRQKGACCAGQDIHDARRVAAALDIPHYVLDFESRFRQAVIDDFVDGYLAGTTPIPCVRCNQTVKFADLLHRSRELGAAALATGHYVDSRPRAGGSPHRDLFTPSDMARDQSYFLFATTRDQADFLRFPLGWLDKRETRRIAESLGLTVASKPDSQDICFVPAGKYADLILKVRPDAAKPGELVHIDGRVLGRHDGIIHFTIGQRRGLGISEGEPLYVTAIEAATRRVVVGPREALRRSDIRLASLNWLGDGSDAPNDAEVYARIRSTRPPVAARVMRDSEGYRVALPGGEYGVSPGQACVLYEGWGAGSRLLGGGFIVQEKAVGAKANRALRTG